ncbi:MAG: cobaltochelatase subunit CobN, partial [archaeon]|nr:cobaltochelatase subunit CobN [archaeon]
MVRIACLGVNGKYDDVLRPVAGKLVSEGHDISVIGSDSVYLDEHPEEIPAFMEDFCSCDFAEINVHGDLTHFRHYRRFMERIAVSGCSILLRSTEPETIAEYRHLFRQSDEEYDLLMRYESIGGDDNHRSTLLWVLNTFGGEHNVLPDPVIPMNEGVYIPGKGSFTLGEGLKDVGSSGRPVVGILFLQKYWLDHNIDFVDSIYRYLEEFGAEPVPVFLSSGENAVTGAMGVKRIVKEHLMRDGRPVFDSIIETMGFSQTVLAQPGSGMQVCKDNFFETMGVPVIQAINLYGPPSKWKDSPLGLTAADIAMSVVDPEYDGQIDGVPFGGSVRREDGTYHVMPIEDRCRMLSETAFLWAKLRHIPNGGRKVAVLVYMYPPRQDLAGGGYGLDTPESVSNLLKQMSQCGYSLDWVPEDGRDLVERLLAGITNDDSSISDDQIRDTAVDTVSPKRYFEWFSEIAESAQKRYVGAWGEPPGDLHVHEGNLLLPGIMNGNVFIGFQPDRGKCTVDAYHDTEAAPPHQYLAFYRWLKYVWGADAVVHMGTHGTLEWLPGKGTGLSSECDPDIILGNLPNINPYIIDNPGEGMQAKRRSYAVITTHMIPAMVRAGGYDRLEELESLVQTYLKAKE